MTINNLPAYARECAFVVARDVDGEFWFWGAYDDAQTAAIAASEIGGIVFDVNTIA